MFLVVKEDCYSKIRNACSLCKWQTPADVLTPVETIESLTLVSCMEGPPLPKLNFLQFGSFLPEMILTWSSGDQIFASKCTFTVFVAYTPAEVM